MARNYCYGRCPSEFVQRPHCTGRSLVIVNTSEACLHQAVPCVYQEQIMLTLCMMETTSRGSCGPQTGKRCCGNIASNVSVTMFPRLRAKETFIAEQNVSEKVKTLRLPANGDTFRASLRNALQTALATAGPSCGSDLEPRRNASGPAVSSRRHKSSFPISTIVPNTLTLK